MKPENIDAKKIVKIRESLGYSSAKSFAKDLGSSERSVQRYESGKYQISRIIAYAIIGFQMVKMKERKKSCKHK